MAEENPVDQDVDNLFDGADETEVVAEDKPEETLKVEDTPTGDEEKPTPPVDEKPQTAPIAALMDERRKAQRLRQENEELRKQIPVSNEAPDPYDDIDTYNAFMRKQWESESYEAQEKVRLDNIETSRGQMLEKHTDFVEMERLFQVMVSTDPSLAEKRIASGNEPLFAYESAKKYKDEILGAIGKTETPTETLTDLPNLAKATDKGSNAVHVEKEEDMNDIFADQPY